MIRRYIKNKFTNRDERGSQGGFTIIETLVAITILMIAVAGPLVVASKGLNAALYARDQIIATYLAQESMETIKNVRDNNLYSYIEDRWLEGIVNIRGATCTLDTDSCDISPLDAAFTVTSGCDALGCQIYYNKTKGYSSFLTGADTTIFKRYYFISKAGNKNLRCETLPDKECTAHIVVTWNEGTVPYEVNLDSELVKNLR